MELQDYSVPKSDTNDQDALVSELLKKFASRNQTPPSQDIPKEQAASGVPFGDTLSALLQNRDLITKLPQIISAAKPILDIMSKQGSLFSATPTESASSVTDSSVPAAAIPAYPAASIKARNDSDRVALLCAMKPYLSHDRQTAIDYIIKLSRLGDILKTL
ncbi:MAG: hypothetical protein E7649_05270 [Ruminococcaceae bacterium]|nr:hypothetical protein [Oscillospiraceae bacterium]